MEGIPFQTNPVKVWLTANKLEYFIVKEINLDADGWKSQEDFFIALLPKLGAPNWHGHNLDALWDSLVAGQINSTKPPYSITVINVDRIPDILVAYLVKFEKLERNDPRRNHTRHL
ncbi:MAG: barstar family protein [Aestuariivirga sp.]|nr:barstar family protein [Aestuariivirga sp.]